MWIPDISAVQKTLAMFILLMIYIYNKKISKLDSCIKNLQIFLNVDIFEEIRIFVTLSKDSIPPKTIHVKKFTKSKNHRYSDSTIFFTGGLIKITLRLALRKAKYQL